MEKLVFHYRNEFNPVRYPVRVPDTWTIKAKDGGAFKRKLGIWVYKLFTKFFSLQPYYKREASHEVKKVYFDFDKLIREIRVQLDVVERQGYEVERIIIGRDQLKKLMSEIEDRGNPFNLPSVQFRVSPNNKFGDLKIYGIETLALPWVDGLLVVPKMS